MLTYGLPIAVTLFIWWFSTGAILFLDGLPKKTFRWSMSAATILAAFGFYGLYASSSDNSVTGVYTAFVSALAIWAWNEMAFLMGYITGSRRTACPADAKGVQRFIFATQSIIHHEFALLVSGFIILALTWGGINAFGLYTFVLLFVMRLSAKLNIFLGVPNTTVDFLPEHLAYLKSYFAIKPMNLLFPVSVTISTWLAIEMLANVSAAPLGSGDATGYALIATLIVLALVEHWFLVIPLPFGDLWSWGLSSRELKSEPAKPESKHTSEVMIMPMSRQNISDKLNPAAAQASVHWEMSETRKEVLL